MDLRPYLQFNRKLSERMTAVLARTPLTPNAVTTLGLLCGITAGWLMSAGTRGALIAGAAVLHLAFLLDNCDGELARLKGRSTPFGRWYDMTTDVMVDFALWTGLAIGAVHRYGASHWFWFGALAVAASLINFLMVLYERAHDHSSSIHIRKQIPPEVQKSVFHSILETLCHNGDVIALVWIMALVGDPGIFLILAAIYMHLIWIFRCWTYFPKLSQFMLKMIGVGIGVYILYLSTREIQWTELVQLIQSVGPAILWSLLIFPIATFFHAAAFYCLLQKEVKADIPFWRVYWISLFGDAVNKITPFIDVGGEPLKIAQLAKKGIATAQQGLRAAWMTRVLFVLSEVVYLALAVLILIRFFPSEEFLLIGTLGIVFSIVFAGILFYFKDKIAGKGTVKSSNDRGRTAAAFLLQFIGWVIMSVEMWIIFWAMNIPADLLKVFLAQALLQAITTVSFFIPGNIGAQEGGLALLMKHIGFSPEAGIAVSLFKRARQIVWALAGFVYYALSRK